MSEVEKNIEINILTLQKQLIYRIEKLSAAVLDCCDAKNKQAFLNFLSGATEDITSYEEAMDIYYA